jgi:transposase-like protein
MSSKRYTKEFKIEAVGQVTERGYSVAEVAGRLGMTTHSLYAWKMKYGPNAAEHEEKTATEQEVRCPDCLRPPVHGYSAVCWMCIRVATTRGVIDRAHGGRSR